VQKGDPVRITAKDGTIISGRFDTVSDSSLRISNSGRTPRDIPADTIAEVSRKRPESAWNGVLIGLGVGAAGGLVATSVACPNNSECVEDAARFLLIPLFAGGGAAVGAILDKLQSKYDPVYLQQTSLRRPRLQLTPMVARHVKGVRVSVSF
jgi:hypothetical protein